MIVDVAGVVSAVGTDVPVDPSAPDAQQWLLDELSKPEYQAARPTWLDRASQAFFDWLSSLTVPSGGSLGGLLPAVITVVVIALIVIAFFVFGRPERRNRLLATELDGLFGSDDRRTAAELRASAAAAARAGDYRTAIEELYRALARRQSERTVVHLTPGTTAQEFAARAANSYPVQAARLQQAAQNFDGVRYLGAAAEARAYEALVDLERELRDLSPVRLGGLAPSAAGSLPGFGP